MGFFKSLLRSQTTVPSCFHLTHRTAPSPLPTVRLIGSDGTVTVFDRPVPASDLMLRFPRHLICHSDSLFIGQKLPALSPSDQLQLGHCYLLLPAQFFHSVLSFVTVATCFLIRKPDGEKKGGKGGSTCPFDVCKNDKGMLQLRVSEEAMEIRSEGGGDEEIGIKKKGLCDSERLEKEYRELVGDGKRRQWKPRLESIKECAASREREGRRSVLFLLSKKKKKREDR